jgi:hypothetical protein
MKSAHAPLRDDRSHRYAWPHGLSALLNGHATPHLSAPSARRWCVRRHARSVRQRTIQKDFPALRQPDEIASDAMLLIAPARYQV